jgi:hypothetical protein
LGNYRGFENQYEQTQGHQSIINQSSISHQEIIEKNHQSIINPTSFNHQSIINQLSINHKSIISKLSFNQESIINQSSIPSLLQMSKKFKYTRVKCFLPINPLFEIPKTETIWIKS